MKRPSSWISLAPFLLAACTAAAPKRTPVAAPESARSLPAGDVVGFVGEHGSHVYLGLPYAEPPVGARRWRAPEAPPRWSGTREALRIGDACVQFGSRFAGLPIPSDQIGGREDCLYLNVYAPRSAGPLRPGERGRPVMVWIHGGGNVIGQAGNYDGGRLAESQDVIVVAINYRLGPLGWFRHPALRGDGSAEDDSGNYGVLDQIAALAWVRDNVAAFGGDPNNVTIFGESAGGRDVYALLLAPAARGLFHRAIVQSGGLRSATLAEAENFVADDEPGLPHASNEILLSLLVADGTATGRDAARARLAQMSPADVRAYLRSTPAEALLAAYGREGTEGLIDVPQMFPDGTVLPEGDPLEQLATPGKHADVPVMIGTNHDENKLFLFAQPEHQWRFLWVLPRLRDPERFEALARHQSRLWKASGADEPAAALAAAGAPGVYVYRFDWDEEPSVLGSDFAQMLGAAHGFEIPFVFGIFDLGEEANAMWTDDNAPGRERLSNEIMSYWVNFAATGAPGRGTKGDLPAWEPAPAFLIFDTDAGGGLRMSSDTLREEVVLDEARHDPRLGTDEQRCEAYRELLGRTNRHREAPLPGGCAAR